MNNLDACIFIDDAFARLAGGAFEDAVGVCGVQITLPPHGLGIMSRLVVANVVVRDGLSASTGSVKIPLRP